MQEFTERCSGITKTENLSIRAHGAGQNSIALTNFPNPFNEQTTIQFDISEETSTTLTLYDMSGKIITKILDNEILSQGKHEVSFNGNGLDAGVYYYTIQAGTYTGTQRMNLMR